MRGINSVGLHLLMRPLTRASRPASQSIKTAALMAIATIFSLISFLGGFGMHWKVTEPSENNSAGGILALVLVLTMPRARGRPRRGAGWYAADSRWKRHKKFERALVLAKRKRPRESKETDSPPRTYVEEIPSEELPQNFSESLMFTVPDNWNPPACFGADALPPHPRAAHGPSDTPIEEFATCLVEEELSEGNEENICKAPDELKPQREQQAHQEEDDEKKSPPQPPLLHPEHLNLIFEVRSMVDDQIFRVVRINQRLDMLYAAYSSATPRRQCPTCAQIYAIPVRRGKEKDDREDTG
jgi:hypothetical protein